MAEARAIWSVGERPRPAPFLVLFVEASDSFFERRRMRRRATARGRNGGRARRRIGCGRGLGRGPRRRRSGAQELRREFRQRQAHRQRRAVSRRAAWLGRRRVRLVAQRCPGARARTLVPTPVFPPRRVSLAPRRTGSRASCTAAGAAMSLLKK